MTETGPTMCVLTPETVSDEVAEAAIEGTIVAEADVAVMHVRGPSVTACLQGLLTNDIEAVGDGGFLYGAVLTTKGTIVCDMWTSRGSGPAWLSVPTTGKQALLDLFKKYLPPRLATVTDRSDELAVLRIAGPTATQVAHRARIAIPELGRSTSAVLGEATGIVSRPSTHANFELQLQLERDRMPAVLDSLEASGAVLAGHVGLELARILAGWPGLGTEIDAKTLPQEVRYDAIDGVSYTKGCYTGQETVARLHFRGHTNRALRGLIWDHAPNPSESAIIQNDKPVGRVTRIAWLAPFEQYIGLGMVHRSAATEQPVRAADAPAGIVDLPFRFDP